MKIVEENGEVRTWSVIGRNEETTVYGLNAVEQHGFESSEAAEAWMASHHAENPELTEWHVDCPGNEPYGIPDRFMSFRRTADGSLTLTEKEMP